MSKRATNAQKRPNYLGCPECGAVIPWITPHDDDQFCPMCDSTLENTSQLDRLQSELDQLREECDMWRHSFNSTAKKLDQLKQETKHLSNHIGVNAPEHPREEG